MKSGVGGCSSSYELQADDAARRPIGLLKDIKLLNIDDDDKAIKITRINTYGEIPAVLEEESAVSCCENCNHQRRAIVLQKAADSSWGFTLQSYGIHDKNTGLTEVYTYIDYVDFASAAFAGGLRKGDVIIALNGKPTQALSDDAIVDYIRSCTTTIRMVVVSCDICRKVELHTRLQKLKEVLTLKEQEAAMLERRELEVLTHARLMHSGISGDGEAAVTAVTSL